MRQLSLLMLVGTLVACASYAKPPSDRIYPDVIEHPVPDDLSKFKQPASLVEELQKIQAGSLEHRIKALVDKSKRDQVFVDGGTFQMGDFGRLQSKEGLPWDGNSNSSPLHEVTLDSYSISRYKVTLAEFDLYAEANKLPSVQTDEVDTTPIGSKPAYHQPSKPAGTTWVQANEYCNWLGKQTGLSVELPTEAQWEYAARDRGKFIVYPTNNGKLEWNKNVPRSELVGLINDGRSGPPYRIALFPPNPLGLYDLAENGLEWVQDWYLENYYAQSNMAHNPTGPKSGKEKVQRGRNAGFGRASMTMIRSANAPTLSPERSRSTRLNGFRCAVQSPRPVSDNRR